MTASITPRISARGLSANARPVARALRTGERVDDRELDDVFPLEARRSSKVHWTPRVPKPSDSPARARLSSVAPWVVTLASSRSLPKVSARP